MKLTRWLLMLGLPLVLAAQPKKLVNAQVDVRPAAGGLIREIQTLQTAQPQPAWIGYTVPSLRTRNVGCDSWGNYGETTFRGGTVHLEPAADVLLLMRVDANQIGRVRTMAPDCDIDAGGATVHWLTGVSPAESVAMLSAMVTTGERLSDSALSAISLHADPSADTAIEGFVASGSPEWLRRKAVRHLGARGKRGLEMLKRLLAGDEAELMRERAVSALGSNREPETLDLLVSLARSDKSPKVRGQALSSIAHWGGPKATGAIAEALDRDPERDVRRRAVSALRQLPRDEGIPLLIEIAKTNRDAEVRKRAMSELGHSRDPRALKFFEDVLAKP
jgi:HEAT repeat protein